MHTWRSTVSQDKYVHTREVYHCQPNNARCHVFKYLPVIGSHVCTDATVRISNRKSTGRRVVLQENNAPQTPPNIKVCVRCFPFSTPKHSQSTRLFFCWRSAWPPTQLKCIDYALGHVRMPSMSLNITVMAAGRRTGDRVAEEPE